MSLTDRSRALMSRHHQAIRNRQQSLLTRAAEEAGIPGEPVIIGLTFKVNPLTTTQFLTIAVVRP